MDLLLSAVGLVAVVAAVSTLARRLGLLAPLLLVVAGLGLSFVPGFPDYRLDPELVLVVVLPLLLHVASLRASVPAFKANLRPIGLLAVGLVVFTAVVVGLVLHLLAPQIPLAAAVALGAVVAPPDAVAATALARRMGLPRRLVAILEGESLFNDATALVTLRMAVAVAVGASVTWTDVATDLLVASVGGVAVGLVAGRVVAWLHRLTDEPLLDNTLSILTPFVAFIPAEELHASGVVAVVVTGLYVGHRGVDLMTAAARLQMEAFWRVTEFLLQGVVFLLVGLQLRAVLAALVTPGSTVAVTTVSVVAAVVLTRFAWVYPATYLARLLPRVREREPAPPLSIPTVVGWAGMRGVVTMAAAFALPLRTSDGSPFPSRDLLVWLALVVVVVTLLGQGTTLPWLVRHLDVPRDDPTADALTEAAARQEAVRAGQRRLEDVLAAEPVPHFVAERLRRESEAAGEAAWERLGPNDRVAPWDLYARIRREVIRAERDALAVTRDSGRLPEEVWRRLQRDLDLEEALLSTDTDLLGEELAGASATPSRDACEHLARAGDGSAVEPNEARACHECLLEGRDDWVDLRLCLTCGNVGCCDSSPRRHATAHFHGTGHPVIRSFESGETWRWCYLDEVVG